MQECKSFTLAIATWDSKIINEKYIFGINREDLQNIKSFNIFFQR
jgi:hypothetical protein